MPSNLPSLQIPASLNKTGEPEVNLMLPDCRVVKYLTRRCYSGRPSPGSTSSSPVSLCTLLWWPAPRTPQPASFRKVGSDEACPLCSHTSRLLTEACSALEHARSAHVRELTPTGPWAGAEAEGYTFLWLPSLGGRLADYPMRRSTLSSGMQRQSASDGRFINKSH